MKTRPRPLIFLVMLLAGHAFAESSKPEAEDLGAKPNPKLEGYDEGGGEGKTIFEVPIDGTIDLGLASFVERVVDRLSAEDVLVLRIKTFGGRVDAAVRIRDALLESPAPTVAYIDQRAISAGALISLACDTIIMSKGSSIGAATPVQSGGDGEMKPTTEKVVSYMRAEMRATAEAKGRRADIAEAMVDADIEIKGVIAKGKLLTLTSEKAHELKLADSIAPRFEAAIAQLNLQKAEKVATETHWGEKVARFLTDPTVSSLLMSFGFLGLLMELYSPGFGVGGIIGISCLVLFFLGQYAAHLAGWEELIVFAVGFALLMVEIFAIPGFGVAGISGLVLMGVSLVMAMIELEIPLDVSFELGYVQDALTMATIRMAVAVVLLIIGAFVFGKYFPGSFAASWLVFKVGDGGAAVVKGGEAPMGAEAPGGSLPNTNSELLGQRGVTQTVLRPAGTALFGDRRVDVITDGEFLERNEDVVVAVVEGHRVVVRKAPKDAPDSENEESSEV